MFPTGAITALLHRRRARGGDRGRQEGAGGSINERSATKEAPIADRRSGLLLVDVPNALGPPERVALARRPSGSTNDREREAPRPNVTTRVSVVGQVPADRHGHTGSRRASQEPLRVARLDGRPSISSNWS
jgi:hypothetical protein